MNFAKEINVSFLAFGLAFAGCDQSSKRSGHPTDNPLVSMVKGFGEVEGCSDDCVRVAQAMLRADAGVDPRDSSSEAPEDWQELLSSLSRDGAVAASAIRSVPLASGLDSIAARTANRLVLRDASGHILTVLGTSTVEGQTLFETVHGNGNLSILTRNWLLDGDIRSAWQVSKSEPSPVPIHVGTTVLQAERLLHYVGATRNGERLSCKVRFKNTGPLPVVLNRPSASCSCTIIDMTERKQLLPDATLEFGVSTESRGTPTLRATVTLLAYESGSGRSREIKFTILGYEPAQRGFYPHMIEFGSITAGSTATQTITYKETPTNRFHVAEVDCDDRAVRHTLETVTDTEGLSTYLLRFVLSPSGRDAAEHQGTVRVRTEGITTKTDLIPFHCAIVPSLRVSPQVVAFGPIPVGQSRRATVRFHWPRDEAFDLQIESQPEGCSASLDLSRTPPEMTVDVRLKDPGVWQGIVRVKARGTRETHFLEVKCVGLGTSPGP